MNEAVFTPDALAALMQVYPATPIRLTHRLTDHPLLTLPSLAQLATFLPPDSAEFNPGALPIGIAPEDIPPSALGLTETVLNIAHTGSWVALKRIEQHPDYAALLRSLLDEIADVVTPRTGAMHQPEGFIFITSPGGVTPFHFDPEHNILLQIAGSKTMTVFPVEDEAMFGPQVHELFHLGLHHRNLPWEDRFAALGKPFQLQPGQAIHVPVKAPHWVQNGPEPAISLSVTWRSEWSFAEADARAFNHVLRKTGIKPRSPAPFPSRNRAKSLAYRALRRMRG